MGGDSVSIEPNITEISVIYQAQGVYVNVTGLFSCPRQDFD